MALFITLVGVPYTFLLLFWQWIVRAPRWMIFKWRKNTKLNAFIAVHHAPYNSEYRYWTGLLLLVRLILYITALVTVSDNPQVSLLVTNILIGGLLVNKCIRNLRVYKKSITDVVETITYFNLLSLISFSLYHFKADSTKQTAVVYTSTIITFLLLVVVMVYHVYLQIRKQRQSIELNEYLLAPVQPDNNAEVTYSVVEIEEPRCQPSEADSDEGEFQ